MSLHLKICVVFIASDIMDFIVMNTISAFIRNYRTKGNNELNYVLIRNVAI